MNRKFFRAAILSLLAVSLASGAAAADVSIDVQDAEGDDLDGFDISVSGGEAVLVRDNIDRAALDLEEGEYSVEMSKNGYEILERTIFVAEEEDSSYRFTMQRTDEEDQGEIVVSDVEAPDSVCRGQTFPATVKIENTGEEARVVSLTGSGFGQILLGNSFVVEAGESVRYRFIFTGADQTGSKEFTISAGSQDESDSISGSIDVTGCRVPGDASAVESIDMQLYPLGGNSKAFVGEVVRVKGFADGARGSVNLDLKLNGEKIGDVSTDPRGYFKTYFRPNKTGEITVTASAPKTSKSRDLTVEPAPSVSDIRAPERTFSGDEMKICGDVRSATTPKAVLLENGEVIESRLAKGEVCFNIAAPAAGEYKYEIRVLTYGKGDSANIGVKVQEQGSEAKSFPGQVSMVETEPGTLKVRLYNTKNESRNYTARMENLNREWISNPVKTVSLGRGERDTVFFYVSPEKSGNFTGILEVESGGDIIYSDNVEIYSADTRRDRDEKGFFEVYMDLLMALA